MVVAERATRKLVHLAQSRKEPAGYVGLEHLRRIVQEYEVDDEQFPQKARLVARSALASTDPVIARRGIQVLGAIGGIDEIAVITALLEHPDDAVRDDAKASIFELRQQARRGAK